MEQQSTEPAAAPAGSWQAATAAAVPGASGFVYADVPNRIFALIIDAIVLAVIGIVIGVILGIVGLTATTIGSNGVTFNPVATIIYGIIGFLVNVAYFVWSWTSMRATFGMKALGMQVGNAFDGKTLTMEQALRRAIALWGPATATQFFNSVPAIGAVLGLLSLLWVFYLLYTTAKSPTKQGFHDTFANSVVVKAGRVV